MSDKATQCDFCPESIDFGTQCWMVRRGTTIDEVSGKTVPLVKISCQACYDNGMSSA